MEATAERAIRPLAELTWAQLNALPRDRTVILLPVGPLEEHSVHLPLGTDVYEAEHLARVLGEHVLAHRDDAHVLLHPPLPIGHGVLWLPGSEQVPARVVRDAVLNVLRSLARYGFGNVLIVSVHGGPRHLVALEEAAAIANDRHKARALVPLAPIIPEFLAGRVAERLGAAVEGGLSDEEAEAFRSDWHAGLWETSMMLAIRPDLVDPQYRELEPVVPQANLDEVLPRPGERLTWSERLRRIRAAMRMPRPPASPRPGHLGHPHLARAEIAEGTDRALAGLVGDVVLRHLDGEDVAAEARSVFWQVPALHVDYERRVNLALWLFVVVVLVIVWVLTGQG